MKLKINHQLQEFTPIQEFRAQWDLSDEFDMNYFEPKDLTGLGSIEGAGDALAEMKQNVIASVPETITPINILNVIDLLVKDFQYQLQIANKHVGLRFHDVGFAVAGFEDVLRSAAYELLQLNHTYQGDITQIRQNFDFPAVYQNWLDDSARLSASVHVYQHDDQQFEVRVVNHIYGRVGLEVSVANEIYYITDKSLACPGESYMYGLCLGVACQLCEMFGNP
jgi:hypothetical protein